MADQTSRVTDVHPQHAQHADQWQRVADCLGGLDAVRAGADRYLPMLDGHRRHPRLYDAYVKRALFADMTARTVDALIGSIFRKEPVVEVPAQYKPRIEDINGQNDGIATFSKKIARDVLAFGRIGLLVDLPGEGEADRFDPLARLPWITAYGAPAIRNWRTVKRGGRVLLSQIVLQEDNVQDVEFGTVAKVGYLVLELDEQGFYRARRFEAVQGDGGFEEVARVYPVDYRGQPLTEIPFVFISPVDLSPNVCRSPVVGLADVDLSFFRSSADLESGRFKLAFPVPILVGVDDSNTTWQIGGDTVWMLPMGASASMLEFRGDGLGSLERALQEKEHIAATLGARLLQAPKRAAESAESVHLQQSGETSVISSLARTVSDGITKALSIATAWSGISGKVSFELNQDFLDQVLGSAELRELRETALAGLLPFDDFVIALQKGEIIRSNLTVEEVRSLLESDPIPGTARPMELAAPVAPDQPTDQQDQPPEPTKQAAE